MLAKTLKDLYRNGKYQEVLDQLTQKENQGAFASLLEDEQIECLYYKSCSLEFLGKLEGALQVATAEHLLIQAKDEAAQIGLVQLEKEIDLKIQQFREEINKWSVLIKQASLSERLEEAQVKKYIQDAQKIVHSFK